MLTFSEKLYVWEGTFDVFADFVELKVGQSLLSSLVDEALEIANAMLLFKFV